MDSSSAPNAQPVIGVDLGGTKILAAVVSSDGAILGRAKKRTRADQGPTEVIARITQAVQQAAANAGLAIDQIAAVGMGAPGPLDPVNGVIYHTPNLPGWENFPVTRQLSDALGIPVWLENDVNLGTLGEYQCGAGRGTRDMVGIFVGTGVGGGIVVDGKLRSGYRHAAGEVGHMVVAAGGPYCGCGRQGCLEAVASRTAIERDIMAGIAGGREHKLDQFTDMEAPRLTSKILYRAWQADCPLTREVIARAQWYLGLHAASVVDFFDPEMLVYGGGIVEAMDEALLEPIRIVARQHFIQQAGPEIKIVAAELGDDAGVIGAAVMASQRIENGGQRA